MYNLLCTLPYRIVLVVWSSLTPPSKIGKGSGEPRIIDLCHKQSSGSSNQVSERNSYIILFTSLQFTRAVRESGEKTDDECSGEPGTDPEFYEKTGLFCIQSIFVASERVACACANLRMAAFSAEPGRKAPYSTDLRWRVVWQRAGMQLPFRDIARNLNNCNWYRVQYLEEIRRHRGCYTEECGFRQQKILD